MTVFREALVFPRSFSFSRSFFYFECLTRGKRRKGRLITITVFREANFFREASIFSRSFSFLRSFLLISNVLKTVKCFLVIATNQILQMMKKNKNWFVEGTFKSCPQNSYQVFTVHCFMRGMTLPCIYGIFPDKKHMMHFGKMLKGVRR